MKNIKGNLTKVNTVPGRRKADAICITTNGFQKTNGACVMGKGCALQFAELYPDLPFELGYSLEVHGNIIAAIGEHHGATLVAFPVKPEREDYNGSNVVRHMASKFKAGQSVPGWACKARVDIIKSSAIALEAMATKEGWEAIILPRPGCGAGELSWTTIEPILQQILDDRFYAMTFS